ncbi:MAG: CesT family type III secretion system chaperone [Burkholderiales bacterium]|nr:CesT family type III secretion system chaperone [Burkholderiales bacterium]
MSPSAQALYAQLAQALGVEAIPADAQGIVQLEVGDEGRVVIVPEDAHTLMLLSPVAPLPSALDKGTLLWLMRRNFHDSPLAPFRIGCDKAGNVVVWGRLPIDGLSGEQLAGLLDAVAAEAALIREEIATDEEEGAEAA